MVAVAMVNLRMWIQSADVVTTSVIMEQSARPNHRRCIWSTDDPAVKRTMQRRATVWVLIEEAIIKSSDAWGQRSRRPSRS
jgi:hypothetical protein